MKCPGQESSRKGFWRGWPQAQGPITLCSTLGTGLHAPRQQRGEPGEQEPELERDVHTWAEAAGREHKKPGKGL